MPRSGHPTDARSLSRLAETYYRQHLPVFAGHVRNEVLDILNSKYWLSLIAFTVAAAANIPYNGLASFLYLAPAIALTLAAAILSRLPATRTALQSYAPACFDGMFLLAVAGLSFLWMKILADGKRPDGNPVQFTLAVISMFPYRTKYWQLVVRNALYAGTMALIFYCLVPSFFMESRGYFVGGMGIGSWLALMGHHRERIRFYTQGILQSLNLHLHNELASLVYDHQRKMLEDYKPLDQTMELSPRMAYIGEFDIVGSSSLVSNMDYEKTKNRVFARCYERVLKNYAFDNATPDRPVSDGHVVKEMGDGFIFSVGFPFAVPPSKNPADVALDLSLEFLALFDQEMKPMSPNEDVGSVVVLTKSTVAAFWTQYKVRAYEFEQKCMSRVVRLSELRRALSYWRPQLGKSYVLMEESFGKDLSSSRLSETERIDIYSLGLQVRNHPEIKAVYIRSLKPGMRAAA